MSGIIDCSTTDPSVRRKCWEIMVKPGLTKLKNNAVSFWCFLALLISHASMMDWNDVLTFTVNGAAINLLKQFVLVPLDMIIATCNTRKTQAALPPPATRTTPGPTAAAIARFKVQGMFAWILNTCDEELQLWIGNSYDKIQEDGTVVLKLLSHKIVQCAKASMRLARTTLHAMTLNEHNNNVEKLVEAMESKIKLLSCGGEEPSSIFADIFRIFGETTNDDLKSLVSQCSRLCDEGQHYECEFLLQTFVTKHKQLVAEGEWKDAKDEVNIVALLQQVQKENLAMKNYVMNLAQRTEQNKTGDNGQDKSKTRPGQQHTFAKWRITHARDTITRNGKTYNGCIWHKRHVLSHTSADCRENPSHPQHNGNKQKNKDAETEAGQPDLAMNLMEQQQDYAPINPWISLAITDDTAPLVGDIEQAIPAVEADKDSTEKDKNVDNEQSEASKEENVIVCSPHTSFWGHLA